MNLLLVLSSTKGYTLTKPSIHCLLDSKALSRALPFTLPSEIQIRFLSYRPQFSLPCPELYQLSLSQEIFFSDFGDLNSLGKSFLLIHVKINLHLESKLHAILIKEDLSISQCLILKDYFEINSFSVHQNWKEL